MSYPANHPYGVANCKVCGATFAASRTGRTVNCPDHRAGAAAKAEAAAKAAAEAKVAKRIGVSVGGVRVAEWAPADGAVYVNGEVVGHAKSPASAVAVIR